MKLIDLINDIENINEELIIFQEDKNDFNSDIIVSLAEKGDNLVKEERGKKYYYLIEIYLAKEFIKDWVVSLDCLPNNYEIARRLYKYAINDA